MIPSWPPSLAPLFPEASTNHPHQSHCRVHGGPSWALWDGEACGVPGERGRGGVERARRNGSRSACVGGVADPEVGRCDGKSWGNGGEGCPEPGFARRTEARD